MNTKFPQRLKELREEQRLLQSQLASRLGVCKSAVSGWEVGRNQPNYDMLIQIAELFGVTSDYLIGRTDY